MTDKDVIMLTPKQVFQIILVNLKDGNVRNAIEIAEQAVKQFPDELYEKPQG
jgi:hypothetical protein